MWRRHLLGGAAVATSVPAVILVAAIAVGVAGGGVAGLRSFGQALTGPALPGVEPPPARSGDRRDDPGRLLERSLPAAGGERQGGDGARPGSPATGSPGEGGGGSPTTPDGTDRPVPPASPTPAPTPRPGPTPTPSPTPGPVRQITGEVREVTDGAPVVGEPVGEVLDVLVETVEGLEK